MASLLILSLQMLVTKQFNYPTLMFKQPSIELDEDNHPYWIAPIKKHTISLFGGEDIAGVVIVDAVNSFTSFKT